MSAPLCIVLDPPWPFGDKLPGGSRGAAKNYACMSVPQITGLLVETIDGCPNVVAFCWRVASMQQEALNVLAGAGLTVKSEIVWEKLTRRGMPFFAMGRYVRMAHEVCLIATAGRALPEVRNERSRFGAAVREHSRKPEEFYQIVEAMYPSSPKVELFARTRRKGWAQHGDQLGKFEAAG